MVIEVPGMQVDSPFFMRCSFPLNSTVVVSEEELVLPT